MLQFILNKKLIGDNTCCLKSFFKWRYLRSLHFCLYLMFYSKMPAFSTRPMSLAIIKFVSFSIFNYACEYCNYICKYAIRMRN